MAANTGVVPGIPGKKFSSLNSAVSPLHSPVGPLGTLQTSSFKSPPQSTSLHVQLSASQSRSLNQEQTADSGFDFQSKRAKSLRNLQPEQDITKAPTAARTSSVLAPSAAQYLMEEGSGETHNLPLFFFSFPKVLESPRLSVYFVCSAGSPLSSVTSASAAMLVAASEQLAITVNTPSQQLNHFTILPAANSEQSQASPTQTPALAIGQSEQRADTAAASATDGYRVVVSQWKAEDKVVSRKACNLAVCLIPVFELFAFVVAPEISASAQFSRGQPGIRHSTLV